MSRAYGWNARMLIGFGEPVYYPSTDTIRISACSMIEKGRTRPSIHMPRWASRIQLRIIDIRVERLQDISETDAKAEGLLQTDWDGEIMYPNYLSPIDCGHIEDDYYSAVESFQSLWQSINGEQSWTDNPWVWVVEFERIT